MERSKPDKKERSPNGPSLYNQNTILMNIVAKDNDLLY